MEGRRARDGKTRSAGDEAAARRSTDVGGERARRCFAAATSDGFRSRRRGWILLVARAPTLAVEKMCGARGRGRRRAARGVILGRARRRDVRGTTRDRCGEVETSTRVAGSRSTSRPSRSSRGISQSPNDGFPRRARDFAGGRRGEGTHVTTRAGGLVATISTTLLGHGVRFGPVDGGWRGADPASVSASRFRCVAKTPERCRAPAVTVARGRDTSRDDTEALARRKRHSRRACDGRGGGRARTCCVNATRKEGSRFATLRLLSRVGRFRAPRTGLVSFPPFRLWFSVCENKFAGMGCVRPLGRSG